MATGIKWIGLSRWRRENDTNDHRVRADLKKRGKNVGVMVQKDAKAEFTGKVSDKNRRRSGGGNKLGTYSGKLQRAISTTVTVRRDGIRIEIGPTGSSGFYGAVHELGLGRYPARPFLGPAVEKNTEAVFRELGLAIKVIR